MIIVINFTIFYSGIFLNILLSNENDISIIDGSVSSQETLQIQLALRNNNQLIISSLLTKRAYVPQLFLHLKAQGFHISLCNNTNMRLNSILLLELKLLHIPLLTLMLA